MTVFTSISLQITSLFNVHSQGGLFSYQDGEGGGGCHVNHKMCMGLQKKINMKVVYVVYKYNAV